MLTLHLASRTPSRNRHSTHLSEVSQPPDPTWGEGHISADASFPKRHDVIGGAVGGGAGLVVRPVPHRQILGR
jgi:hypothetical protein